MVIEFAKGVALLLTLSLSHGFVIRRWRHGEPEGQVISGLLFGAICVLGMSFPLEVRPGVIFDARSVILSMAGLFGGPVVAAVAAAISAGYRIWIGGGGAVVGVGVIVSSALLGVAYRYARARHGVRVNLINLVVFGAIVQGISTLWFLELPVEVRGRVIDSIILPFLATFIPATALFGLLLRDIETRLRMEADLIAGGERYKALYNRSPVMMHSLDRHGVVVGVNDFWLQTLGYRRDDVIGRAATDFMVPESRDAALRDVTPKLLATGEVRNVPCRFMACDGGAVDVLLDASAERNTRGEVVGSRVVMANVTEKRAQAEALNRAQKMEAVGQLTGGLAHDFNNLLTVVLGNAELVGIAVGDDPRIRRYLARLQAAAERGRSLIVRLLAFSRRQPLSARPTDVNALVRGLSDMMRTSLGEAITVKFELDHGAWPALVDGSQLEHALINLVLNARDAMKDGGTLVLRSENMTLGAGDALRFHELSAGDYLRVTVSDTGTGMPPDVVEHAFEPFFTTKEVGQGSGLGLSMVYGFVRQTGGQIVLASAPGRGTEVSIYLPRATAAAAPAHASDPAGVGVSGGGESILLVEDDDAVRELPVAVLTEAGYRVTAVRDGRAALAALAGGAHVDLLFTDMVLPGGMNGEEVARAARRLQPGLRVLFTTGYAEDDIEGLSSAELLRKPYARATMLAKIRALLEQATPARGANAS